MKVVRTNHKSGMRASIIAAARDWGEYNGAAINANRQYSLELPDEVDLKP
jgi:hypothetical protein